MYKVYASQKDRDQNANTIAIIDRNNTYAIADSGANISVTNDHTVKQLGLEKQPMDKPLRVKFGNGSVTECTHFVNMGNILGRVYVVEGAPDTLISIAVICARGYTVTFDHVQGLTIANDHQPLYQRKKDTHSGLYHLDLTHLFTNLRHSLPSAPVSLIHGPHALGVRTVSPQLVTKILWLHKRMHHKSRADMRRAIECGAWLGVDEEITPQAIDLVMNHTPCTACALAKRNKLKREEGSTIRPQRVGEVLSVDYMGPITPTSARGYTGYLLYKDLFSKYINVVLTKRKPNSETFVNATTEIVEFYKSYGHQPHTLRFDAGTTENSALTSSGLRLLRLHPDPAAVNSQFQNPIEREAQTANKAVAAMLLDQESLGPSFWDYAIEDWAASANATPREGQTECPQQIVTDRSPDLSSRFLYPFGCPLTTIKTEGKENKFATASEYGIAVGSSVGSNRAVKVYVPRKGTKAVERLDVQPLRITIPGAATEVEKPNLVHEYTEDGGVKFKSPAPLTTEHLHSPGRHTRYDTRRCSRQDVRLMHNNCRYAEHGLQNLHVGYPNALSQAKTTPTKQQHRHRRATHLTSSDRSTARHRQLRSTGRHSPRHPRYPHRS